MIRRTASLVVAVALGLLAAPLTADAQQPAKGPRIGVLLGTDAPTAARNPRMQAFYQALRGFGWVEGENVAIERRYAEGDPVRLADLSAELARLNVDVIVTASTPPAKAAKTATGTIPIVMLDPGDPMATGLVASLARPGGNVTGVISIAPDLAAKRLEMLKEAAPKISRVAVLFNAAMPAAEVGLKDLQRAAQLLGLQLQSVAVQGPKGFQEALGAMTKWQADGLLVYADPLTFVQQDLIVGFAGKNRIAALFGAKEFVDAGGLMSYGPSYADMFRRGAYYVDRILKGTKPADLPVEQPTRFELVVNMKTAKALGLTLPQSILLRADQVTQ